MDVETQAGMPLEGSGVSLGCFQPQTLGSANRQAGLQPISFFGAGTGRSRLRAAGGPISISQRGKGARVTNTNGPAKNTRNA